MVDNNMSIARTFRKHAELQFHTAGPDLEEFIERSVNIVAGIKDVHAGDGMGARD